MTRCRTLETSLRSTWFGSSLDNAPADGPAIARPGSTSVREEWRGSCSVEGGRSDELGVVASGRLALRMLVPERGMVTILTVEPGDLYGWSAIASPQRATSTVVAIEPSELIAFDGMALRLALAEDPILAAAVYPRVLDARSESPTQRDPAAAPRPVHPAGVRRMVTATTPTIDPTEPIGFLARPELDRLVEALRGDGRRVIGPTVADGAVVYDESRSQADLPAGWRADQAPGHYRLEHRGGDSPVRLRRGTDGLEAVHVPAPGPGHRRAAGWWTITFQGRRRGRRPPRVPGGPGCELAAIGIQDTDLMAGPAVDADYAARRSEALIVAIECMTAASTCFCTSMGTGPEVRGGVRPGPDRARRRIRRAGRVAGRGRARDPLAARAAVEARAPGGGDGRRRGDAPLDRRSGRRPTACRPASSPTSTTRTGRRSPNAASRSPTAPSSARPASARASASGPTWTGPESGPERTWDSCFTAGFARVAGGNFRPRTQDRYRQWLTHKFATWWDQFGFLGLRRLRTLRGRGVRSGSTSGPSSTRSPAHDREPGRRHSRSHRCRRPRRSARR